jgi:hypothetical protein
MEIILKIFESGDLPAITETLSLFGTPKLRTRVSLSFHLALGFSRFGQNLETTHQFEYIELYVEIYLSISHE